MAALACSESTGGGLVGEPGGANGVRMEYVTARLQVVPADTRSSVVVSLRITRTDTNGQVVPFAGANLRVSRARGQGTVTPSLARANASGIVSANVETPGRADRSEIVFELQDDAESHLPFDVVSAPVVSIDLARGGVEARDLPADGVLLRFPAGRGAKHTLIPFATDTDRSGTDFRFLFQGGTPGATTAVAGADGVRSRRGRADVIVHDGDVAVDRVPRGALRPADGIPATMDIQSCRITTSRAAPLRHIGERIAIYVDGPVDQHQARIDSLGTAFDELIFPVNTEIYGTTTDLDNNDRVLVVMTPEFAGQNKGGVYCDSIRQSGMETFYSLWQPSDPLERTLATLAHEHQHVINASHHFRSRGEIGDDLWINEGLSFAAEGLNGFWSGVLIRAALFLNGQNTGRSMLPLDYQPSFNEKYMMFMFYLGDRFGPTFYQRLGNNGRAGVPNIESVTGLSFEELLGDWFVANAISNMGINNDTRFNYKSINLQDTADRIADCACLPFARFTGMAMQPLFLDRPFDVFRTLDGIDADYFVLVEPEATAAPTYDVYFDAFGIRDVGLSIVRTE